MLPLAPTDTFNLTVNVQLANRDVFNAPTHHHVPSVTMPPVYKDQFANQLAILDITH